jgi:hypothetical protein
MKAYWWKTECDSYIGMAAGRDWDELFWAVDHQVDPYSCKYIPLSYFCASWKSTYEDEDVDQDAPDMIPEINNDGYPHVDDPRWKTIDWDRKTNWKTIDWKSKIT